MRIIALVMFISFNCSIFGQVPYEGKQAIIKSEFIYQPADVPFPGCHASTIAETKNGLIAAWFGGTEERNPDVGIWVSIFKNGNMVKTC